MALGLELDEHGQPQPQPLRVEQRNTAENVAILFKALDPLPARRGGQVDGFGQVLEGHRRVALKQGEDVLVETVHIDRRLA
ncbi:hypothetical protein D3C81_1433190 [compost metagenome]